MAFLSPLSQAETYQDAQQADCYYATSDMVGKCAGHESKRDFAFSSIAKMITPQSVIKQQFTISVFHAIISLIKPCTAHEHLHFSSFFISHVKYFKIGIFDYI